MSAENAHDPPSSALPPRVQRVDLHASGRVVLELFSEGGRAVRAFDPETPERGFAPREARPPHDDERPPAAQKILREALVPSVLVDEVGDDARGTRTLTFVHKSGRRAALVVEARGAPPRVVLLALKDDAERVLFSTGPRRADDGRLLDKGARYAPPPPRAPRAILAEEALRREPDDDAPAVRSPLDDARALLLAEERRLSRLVQAIERDLSKHGDPARLFLDGDHVKARLASLARGQRTLVVDDGDGERAIALDPARSPHENMELLYKRARRARTALSVALPRRDDVAVRLARVRQALAETEDLVESAPGSVDEEGFLARARTLVDPKDSGGGRRARVKPKDGPRLPYRAFVVAGGARVLVGRSARDNDALTFHVANGNDTWMHTRDAPGSHVVVKVARERLTPEQLRDAAMLALWFSPLRASLRGEVIVTSCKHVKKPGRDAAPGLVHVREERTIHVAIDEARMRALLMSEGAEAPRSA